MGGGKKLIHRLVIPFILLCLLFGNPLSIQYLVRILYGRTAGVPGTAHLWFLPCFFLSAYLYNLIIILTRRYSKLIRFTCFFILAFVSSLLHYDSDYVLNGILKYYISQDMDIWMSNISFGDFFSR